MQEAVSPEERSTHVDEAQEKLLVCFERVDDHVEGPDLVLLYTTVVVTMGKEKVVYAGPTDFLLAAGLTLREFEARYRPVDPTPTPRVASRCAPDAAE